MRVKGRNPLVASQLVLLISVNERIGEKGCRAAALTSHEGGGFKEQQYLGSPVIASASAVYFVDAFSPEGDKRGKLIEAMNAQINNLKQTANSFFSTFYLLKHFEGSLQLPTVSEKKPNKSIRNRNDR